MVQIPFTWRYGGHQVFLSGSFNGWSARIPMVLLEGSETTFQRIIDLPPGCYQYKFLVDDTWRVDPQQICDPDEYGTMNNIVLVSSTEFISRDFNAEAFQASTSRLSALPAVGSSSGGSLNDPVLQVSDEEVDVFRQVLSMHMSSSAMFELIPISGKVIALDVEVDVEQAFHVMYDLGLTVVPLWDEHHRQMTGMLTASDFIFILLQLHRNHATFANGEFGIQTISSWKSWKLQHHRDIIGTMPPLQRRALIYVNVLANVDSVQLTTQLTHFNSTNEVPIWTHCKEQANVRVMKLHGLCIIFQTYMFNLQADPDESFAHAASRILQNNISAVPIIHSVNGSWPRLLHVACLSGILNSVCSHFRNHLGYLTLLQQPVGYLPVGTWAVEVRRTSGRLLLTLCPNDPLISALILLLEAQISSIPIVDNGGIFVNLYSRSDITSLAKDNIYTRIQLNQITVSQALELTGERGRNRYKTCTRFDSLYRVMELLSEPDVRRVIVIEASSLRVEGIITLRDVFEFFSR